MNLKDIKGLIQEFDASGVHKLSLELEDLKISLEKEPTPAAPAMPPMPHVYEMPVPQQPVAPVQQAVATAAAEPVEEEAGYKVKSPLVGTFYAAGAPGAKPYVAEGQMVSAGDTVCIVEAMKMMNEIQSPVNGVVEKILVKDGEMVEFDQIIMIIKE